MQADSEHNEHARLQWQCRRGMCELDVLLQDFLDTRYTQLDDRNKDVFRKLLTCSDQVLFEYLMGKLTPMDGDIAYVVEQIRHTSQARS